MSLYDDIDENVQNRTKSVTGWNSGIKLLQSQLQLKKAMVTQVWTKKTSDNLLNISLVNVYSLFTYFSLKERPLDVQHRFLIQFPKPQMMYHLKLKLIPSPYIISHLLVL